MIAHFNYNRTIGEIHSSIDASRPCAARTYQLQTVGFPPKKLTDPNQTIDQFSSNPKILSQLRRRVTKNTQPTNYAFRIITSILSRSCR